MLLKVIGAVLFIASFLGSFGQTSGQFLPYKSSNNRLLDDINYAACTWLNDRAFSGCHIKDVPDYTKYNLGLAHKDLVGSGTEKMRTNGINPQTVRDVAFKFDCFLAAYMTKGCMGGTTARITFALLDGCRIVPQDCNFISELFDKTTKLN